MLYGWNAHLNLQDAPDAAAHNPTYGSFSGYYLAQMKNASDAAGRRLLHRYDMDCYPEARGDNRIVFGSSPGTNNDIDARLQAPRSLWDPGYVETSWITQHTTNGQGNPPAPAPAHFQVTLASRQLLTGVKAFRLSSAGGARVQTVASAPTISGSTFTDTLPAMSATLYEVQVSSPSASPAQLGNISTRVDVGTGGDVLIAGFIITGSEPKRVIVRAIGPSLPLATALADPTLELLDRNRAVLAENNNWGESANRQEIVDSGVPPAHDKESAIVRMLNPGAYTAIVRGLSDSTGLALVEAYDLSQPASSKLANISTRGSVGTNSNVLIGGFIVVGNDPVKVAIRAIGPSLRWRMEWQIRR